MNLTKLFNFKYLKQNLKKSKGLLAILILIIPILTTLVLISTSSSEYECLVDAGTYNAINFFGMYIFPFIISVVLSGYVYKRNSVDFINSMPMNRKTIYFTNFIGGILIIALTQLLTLITGLVCSNILSGIFLPIGLVIDSFVVMFISYVFVYSATMLALTLSGNILTQVVVTALIVFLIPFTNFALFCGETRLESDIAINYGSESITFDEVYIPEYTMPFNLISSMLYGSNLEFFSVTSMMKMIGLSAIYFILGVVLFEKRKMENVGTSFESYKSHYIVKALTMVPMVFLANVAHLEGVYIAIVITIMCIYYVLYDFILSKKVKLKYTIILFIVTLVALEGFYKFGIFVDKKEQYNISISEISGIAVSSQSNSWRQPVKTNKSLDILIEEPDMIEKIVSKIVDRNYFEDTFMGYDRLTMNTPIRIKLNNGKNIYSYVNIEKDMYNEIMNFLKTNEKYAEKTAEVYEFDEFAVASKEKLLPKEQTARIREILEQTQYKVDADYDFSNPCYTEVYVYDNHAVKTIHIDINVNEEIFDIITKFKNEQTYLDFSNNVEVDGASIIKCTIQNNDFVESHDAMPVNDEVINYVKNHYKDKCDYNKDFLIINFYTRGDTVFYTNFNDELNNILKNVTWEEDKDVPVTQ